MKELILVIALLIIGIAGYIVMAKFGIFFEEKKRNSVFRKKERDTSCIQPHSDPFDDEL